MVKTIKEGHLGGFKADFKWSVNFPNLWTWMVKEHSVSSVIDVGCAQGHSLAYFESLGLSKDNLLGVEGSRYGVENAVIEDCIVQHDYQKSGYTPNKEYDLVWCHDFLEHIKEECIQNFLDTFKKGKILIVRFGMNNRGYHHVNPQNADYWKKVFATIGFEYDEELTLKGMEITQKGYKDHIEEVKEAYKITQEKIPYLIDFDLYYFNKDLRSLSGGGGRGRGRKKSYRPIENTNGLILRRTKV